MGIMDYVEDAWDGIVDAWDYFISFSWIEDAWEFITSIFDNISEFSFMGLTFGLLVMVFIYFASPYMLQPFLVHMGKAEALFWGAATYIGSGIIGYIIGQKLWDD